MTTVGGLGHALPYLIPHFWAATITAIIVVLIELWAIAWIQSRYMDTPFLRAAFQVVLLVDDLPRGALVYCDAFWALDCVGLRDPFLAEIEERFAD